MPTRRMASFLRRAPALANPARRAAPPDVILTIPRQALVELRLDPADATRLALSEGTMVRVVLASFRTDPTPWLSALRYALTRFTEGRPAVSASVGWQPGVAPEGALLPVHSESVEELRRALQIALAGHGFAVDVPDGPLSARTDEALARGRIGAAFGVLWLSTSTGDESFALRDLAAATRAARARDAELMAARQATQIGSAIGGTWKRTRSEGLAWDRSRAAAERVAQIETRSGALRGLERAPLPSPQSAVPGVPAARPLTPAASWGGDQTVVEAAQAVRVVERLAPLLADFPEAVHVLAAARAKLETGPKGVGFASYGEESLRADKSRADGPRRVALLAVHHLGGGAGWPLRGFYGTSSMDGARTTLDALRVEAHRVDFSPWFPRNDFSGNPHLELPPPPAVDEAIARTLDLARERGGNELRPPRRGEHGGFDQSNHAVSMWRAVWSDAREALASRAEQLTRAKAGMLVEARRREKAGGRVEEAPFSHDLSRAMDALYDYEILQTFAVALSAGLRDPAGAISPEKAARVRARKAELTTASAGARRASAVAVERLARELEALATRVEAELPRRVAAAPALRSVPFARATPAAAGAALREQAGRLRAREYGWPGTFEAINNLGSGDWTRYARASQAGDDGPLAPYRMHEEAAYAAPLRELVDREVTAPTAAVAARAAAAIGGEAAAALVDADYEIESLEQPWTVDTLAWTRLRDRGSRDWRDRFAKLAARGAAEVKSRS